ncbi:hypothetical protein O181_013324 [Austropuccinia psidii MF-1]|uniref:Uncharacterized protein n=1 Tax=Austropuccinia psidii MF-1 TaxID=1389203 RepID=A0A9Q3BW75_9BASI|nr:hypothetical protein [Austropuccinia psidii MF-1]
MYFDFFQKPAYMSTPLFHPIKVSAKIPTAEELFKEVKLRILRQSGTKDHSSLALQLCSKPKKELCHKGKHNHLANHSERKFFQLFPEKREAYHHRTNDKHQQVMGSGLAFCNNTNNISNKPVLDSGCSNTIAPTSDVFSNISPSRKTLLAANGSDMKFTSEDTLHLNNTNGTILIPNSFIVPSASSVLVSLAIMNYLKPKCKSKINPTCTLCMLVGIQEGHHNYCLFDPKTGSTYISHNCVFKNKESFWPSHSSSTPTLAQEPLLLPLITLFNFSLQNNNQDLDDKSENVLSVPGRNFPGDSSRIPHAIPICDTSSKADSSSSTPPFPGQISSTSPVASFLPNVNRNAFPKRWTYDFLPVEALQNVNSNIFDKKRFVWWFVTQTAESFFRGSNQ